MFLTYIKVLVAQYCEYMKNHQTVHFQVVKIEKFISEKLNSWKEKKKNGALHLDSLWQQKKKKKILLKGLYASKFGKLSSGHRTGKGQFSFQFQRKAMPKNAQTTTQLHSSHTLVK